MRKISDTIARLAALRSAIPAHATDDGRLSSIDTFGSNPGALRGRFYAPPALAVGAALVVVLHGCTQNAAGYDVGSGWSEMADRHGFAVLFPEQQKQNNPNLCFNWFQPEDSRRDSGEALSIRQMVAAVVAAHAIDPARIFVTGLSAGGAMAAVMLATYPEVFAGGAIIAGLPYGSATSVPQAFDRMRGHQIPDGPQLTRLVRSASNYTGPWPTVSIWHGSADATVSLANAKALSAQWGALHATADVPDRIEAVGSHSRKVWLDRAGREVIEEYTIAGMGHGTPLGTALTPAATACGKPGPYMLEAGISSTHHICRFWGLAPSSAARTSPRSAVDAERRELVAADGIVLDAQPRLTRIPNPEPSQHASPANGPFAVRHVIEDALRKAGLMR